MYIEVNIGVLTQNSLKAKRVAQSQQAQQQTP